MNRFRRFQGSLTYANVMSTLALFIALGAGTAFAAGQLAPKSVGAPQLRPGAVTADKLRKNAVTAPKIEAQAVKQGKLANGAIVTEKIASGAVTAAKIENGSITTEKVPNDSLTGEKINESSLGRVPSANTANFSVAAETSNPEAFAKVDAEGTVFPANSKGIGTADVRQGKLAGIYCVNVPGFSPRGAQVTPEYSANNSVDIFVKFGGTESCPAPQVEVRSYNAGSLQKGPFYIVFYR
jgi:hypothetical protein